MNPEDVLKTLACPDCKTVGSVELTMRLVARPLGSFSLAGHQMKTSAVNMPVLACTTEGCGFWKPPKGWPR